MHDHLAHPELPPGPNRWPLRNLYRLTTESRDLFSEARANYGDVFTVRNFGTRPMVVFTTAEAAREVMRENGERLGAANEIVQSVLGAENVLLENGTPHALHRRRLMPALTGDALFAHAPTMKRVIDDGIDALPCGDRVRIVPWARRVTLSVIQQCLFGMREGAEYRALADLVIELSAQGQKPAALMASLVVPPSLLGRITRGRFSSDGAREPDPLLVRGMLRHPLVSANRRVQDALLAHVRGVREGRIDVPPSSMLAELLRLASLQGIDVSDRSLVDDLVTLLIAGHDTTAITLSWLVLLLGRHPSVLAELRDELAREGGFSALEPVRLGQLPYLDATIRESMRVASIASGFTRTTLAPIAIAGVDLPAGVDVVVLAEGPHHDDATFPDPLRFDPAHMLDRRVRPESWFPFGGGYRRCVGAFFATLELKFLVSAFVERVRFDVVHRDGPLGKGGKGIIFEPADGGLLRIDAIRPPGKPSDGRTTFESIDPRSEVSWRS